MSFKEYCYFYYITEIDKYKKINLGKIFKLENKYKKKIIKFKKKRNTFNYISEPVRKNKIIDVIYLITIQKVYLSELYYTLKNLKKETIDYYKYIYSDIHYEFFINLLIYDRNKLFFTYFDKNRRINLFKNYNICPIDVSIGIELYNSKVVINKSYISKRLIKAIKENNKELLNKKILINITKKYKLTKEDKKYL